MTRKAKRKVTMAALVTVSFIGLVVLGMGLIKTTIDRDGWSGDGTPGMLLLTLFIAWAISTGVRAIKR